MKIFNKTQILNALPPVNDLLNIIESGFISYSNKKCLIPPVGYLPLPNGEIHIKYGMEENAGFAVIKIAAGSYKNSALGLPSSSGLNLIYDTKTGFPVSLLYDEGLLTDVRTAIAGALVAHNLSLKPDKFSIIGSGGQAYFQALYTCKTLCLNQVHVYGRSDDTIKILMKKLEPHKIDVIPHTSIKKACQNADLITTVTPSKEPLIFKSWLKPNVHINAFGSDAEGKRELSLDLLAEADLLLCDSIEQCLTQGELQYLNEIKEHQQPVELGDYFSKELKPEEGLSICDFTGVAIQDIKISEAVYKNLI